MYPRFSQNYAGTVWMRKKHLLCREGGSLACEEEASFLLERRLQSLGSRNFRCLINFAVHIFGFSGNNLCSNCLNEEEAFFMLGRKKYLSCEEEASFLLGRRSQSLGRRYFRCLNNVPLMNFLIFVKSTVQFR